MERKIDKILYSVNRKCSLVDVIYLKLYLKKYSYDDVFKMIYDADNFHVVEYAPLSPEDKIKCYVNICDKFGIVYDFYIDKILRPLCNINNDMVLNCLKYYCNDIRRVEMLLRIKDEHCRLLGTLSLNVKTNLEDYSQVVNSIKDKNVLKKAYLEEELDKIAKFCILLVVDDEFKREHLIEVAKEWQIEVILSFKNERYKKEYALLSDYSDWQIRLISSITDEEFIIDCFNANESIMFRVELIYSLENEKLRLKLIDMLQPSVVKDAIKSNDVSFEKFDKYELELIKCEELDKEITFGVELECCGADSKEFLLIQNLLNKWQIKEENSVVDGIEISSPVLKFDDRSLQQLKYICDLLKKGDFYTDQRCGGHIHFGFDYFDTPQDMRTFLELYCAVEDILIVISNKKGSVSREGLMDYAKKFSPMCCEQQELVDLAAKIKKMNDYTRILKTIPKTRYHALNILNIGEREKNTIEFRMPNGEIDFDELLLNILLFAKLMEKAKYLSKLLTGKCKVSNGIEELKKYRLIIDKNISDDERIEVLMDLLFVNPLLKNKYFDRYNDNKVNNNHLLKKRMYVENDMFGGRF